MKTYTSKKFLVLNNLKEFYYQYTALREIKANIDKTVSDLIENYRDVEVMVGGDLSGLDILEIGHGQLPLQLAFFHSLGRQTTGIDLDLVPQNNNIFQFFQVFKNNGFRRGLKTCAREVLGFNSVYRAEFCKQMGLHKFPVLDLRCGDVTERIDMPDNSVDLVYSSDVFEHLSDPEKVIAEIKRVCRDGAHVIVKTLHGNHYNALHDIEVQHGSKPGRWSHLRPTLRNEVVQGAYVNGITIQNWKDIFSKHFNTCQFKLANVSKEIELELKTELDFARISGELQQYEDSELLVDHLIIFCKI